MLFSWPRFLRVRGFKYAGTQNRTVDTVIFSHVLYQLSYPGNSAHCRTKVARVNLSSECRLLANVDCLDIHRRIT